MIKSLHGFLTSDLSEVSQYLSISPQLQSKWKFTTNSTPCVTGTGLHFHGLFCWCTHSKQHEPLHGVSVQGVKLSHKNLIFKKYFLDDLVRKHHLETGNKSNPVAVDGACGEPSWVPGISPDYIAESWNAHGTLVIRDR